MPAKILIVGCGAVAQQFHAPALLNLERRARAEVAGLCDPVEEHRADLGRWFPRARRFAALAEVPVAFAQIALVASPVRWHAEQTVHCLQAGMSVLCEKPIASTTAEAAAMIAAANTHRGLLAVGHVRRFLAGARLIKGIVAEKRFGRLISFHAAEGGNFAWPAKSASFFERKSAGGGVLMDTGIHTMDLLLWWLGQPESFAYEDDSMGGLEANCRLVLDYGSFHGVAQLTRDYGIPNGFFLEFEHAWIRWQPNEAGQIEIGFRSLGQCARGQLCSVRDENGLPWAHQAAALSHQGFLLQWLNVIAAHEGREALLMTGADALVSLSFLEKCYAHRAFMEPPWFTDVEKRRARELHQKASE